MENPLGKVLASGNGKGNRVIYTEWITGVLAIVFCVAMLGFLSQEVKKDSDASRKQAEEIRNLPGYEARMQYYEERADKLAWYAGLVFWMAVGFVPAIFLSLVFYVRGKAKTEITVYENGVIGAGCGILYGFTNRLRRFQLTYDDIVHTGAVDWIFSSAVIIHTPRARYKCYVENPDAILLAIGTAKFGEQSMIKET